MAGVFFYQGHISAKSLAYSLSAATSLAAFIGLAYCIFAMHRQYKSRHEQQIAEEKNAASIALAIAGISMLIALIVNGGLYSFGFF